MTSKECLEKFRKLYEATILNPQVTLAFMECYNTIKQDLNKLEELTYQPTLSECIKEWKKLGWNFRKIKYGFEVSQVRCNHYVHILVMSYKNETNIIAQDVANKCAIVVTFKEHNLLTKTLKALELEECNG